jgi:hypothetical protein
MYYCYDTGTSFFENKIFGYGKIDYSYGIIITNFVQISIPIVG